MEGHAPSSSDPEAQGGQDWEEQHRSQWRAELAGMDMSREELGKFNDETQARFLIIEVAYSDARYTLGDSPDKTYGGGANSCRGNEACTRTSLFATS